MGRLDATGLARLELRQFDQVSLQFDKLAQFSNSLRFSLRVELLSLFLHKFPDFVPFAEQIALFDLTEQFALVIGGERILVQLLCV